jgi:hypothetical protein
MKSNAEEIRKRRQRNIAAGVCRYAASHGPATRGQCCDACSGDLALRTVEMRQDRVKDGVCKYAPSHGPAMRGQLCEACYEVEQRSHTNIRQGNGRE